MTDEQIKQNAEEWVKPLIGEEDGGYNKNDVSLSFMKNAFIAGAHSRDKEFRELLEKYTYEVDSLIAQKEDLQKELYQLHNPR